MLRIDSHAYYHPSGWWIMHCGSELAARPWYLYPGSESGWQPDRPHYGPDGRAWSTAYEAGAALLAIVSGRAVAASVLGDPCPRIIRWNPMRAAQGAA